ncbi:hypothetical protein KTG07_11825 [[Clostridium] innocuum]|nr:hypothetical protein [[Clostridium] innocuum]
MKHVDQAIWNQLIQNGEAYLLSYKSIVFGRNYIRKRPAFICINVSLVLTISFE